LPTVVGWSYAGNNNNKAWGSQTGVIRLELDSRIGDFRNLPAFKAFAEYGELIWHFTISGSKWEVTYPQIMGARWLMRLQATGQSNNGLPYDGIYGLLAIDTNTLADAPKLNGKPGKGRDILYVDPQYFVNISNAPTARQWLRTNVGSPGATVDQTGINPVVVPNALRGGAVTAMLRPLFLVSNHEAMPFSTVFKSVFEFSNQEVNNWSSPQELAAEAAATVAFVNDYFAKGGTVDNFNKSDNLRQITRWLLLAPYTVAQKKQIFDAVNLALGALDLKRVQEPGYLGGVVASFFAAKNKNGLAALLSLRGGASVALNFLTPAEKTFIEHIFKAVGGFIDGTVRNMESGGVKAFVAKNMKDVGMDYMEALADTYAWLYTDFKHDLDKALVQLYEYLFWAAWYGKLSLSDVWEILKGPESLKDPEYIKQKKVAEELINALKSAAHRTAVSFAKGDYSTGERKYDKTSTDNLRKQMMLLGPQLDKLYDPAKRRNHFQERDLNAVWAPGYEQLNADVKVWIGAYRNLKPSVVSRYIGSILTGAIREAVELGIKWNVPLGNKMPVGAEMAWGIMPFEVWKGGFYDTIGNRKKWELKEFKDLGGIDKAAKQMAEKPSIYFSWIYATSEIKYNWARKLGGKVANLEGKINEGKQNGMWEGVMMVVAGLTNASNADKDRARMMFENVYGWKTAARRLGLFGTGLRGIAARLSGLGAEPAGAGTGTAVAAAKGGMSAGAAALWSAAIAAIPTTLKEINKMLPSDKQINIPGLSDIKPTTPEGEATKNKWTIEYLEETEVSSLRADIDKLCSASAGDLQAIINLITDILFQVSSKQIEEEAKADPKPERWINLAAKILDISTYAKGKYDSGACKGGNSNNNNNNGGGTYPGNNNNNNGGGTYPGNGGGSFDPIETAKNNTGLIVGGLAAITALTLIFKRK
jgi:hypothetical protein